MARFGRGQPHPPIFVRGALAAAVIAATLAPQIHVIDQPRAARPLTSRVVFLHGARSVVPARLPPQLTIVSPASDRAAVRPRGAVLVLRAPAIPVVAAAKAVKPVVITQSRQARERPGSVFVVRGQPSQVPPRLIPQITVVTAAVDRRNVRPRGAVFLQRAPTIFAKGTQPKVVQVPRPKQYGKGGIEVVHGAPSVVPARLAPQLHVVSLAAFRRPLPRTAVVVLRAPTIPPPAVAKATPPVVLLAIKSHRPTAGHIVFGHGQPSQVPPRLAPQIHVVSIPAQRSALVGRRADVLFLRTPLAGIVIPPIAAPQSHVLLQPRERAIARGGVLLLRAPTISALAALNRIHVVSLVPARAPLQLVRRARILVLRPSMASLVPPRLAPQIHVLLQRRGTPRTHILVLRGGQPFLIQQLLEALRIQDLGHARYALLDQASVRHPTLDVDPPRYVVFDQSGVRYLVTASGDTKLLIAQTFGPDPRLLSGDLVRWSSTNWYLSGGYTD